MDQEHEDPLSTREFVALWNVAKEEHLGHRFDETLQGLVRRGVLPPLNESQRSVLAHALQLAGDSGAGIPAALQYLEMLSGESTGKPPGA